MSFCSIPGCGGKLYVRGMCSRHYGRLRTTGTTKDGPRARLPLSQRLWKYVDRRGSDECWPWVGKSKVEGYGYISLGPDQPDKKVHSQVAAWMVTYGDLPKRNGYHGTVVRHKCHNRLCCNPAHLEIGSQADNVRDMWDNKNGRRGNTKLTEAQIGAIRRDARSSRKLAPIYGVSDAHIRSIRQGRAWKS